VKTKQMKKSKQGLQK